MHREEMLGELGEAEKLLWSVAVARLAYNGHDGSPRVIPIAFHWTGEEIVVCTAPSAPKVAALKSRPQVALTIDVPGPPARSALLRGSAQIEIVDGVPPEYIAAARKSMEGEQLAAFEDEVRQIYRQMVRIRIAPIWARYFDFGSPRLPGFLRELVGGG
jgi:Pyridoxamine 5'-phosphate oxidase